MGVCLMWLLTLPQAGNGWATRCSMPPFACFVVDKLLSMLCHPSSEAPFSHGRRRHHPVIAPVGAKYLWVRGDGFFRGLAPTAFVRAVGAEVDSGGSGLRPVLVGAPIRGGVSVLFCSFYWAVP